MNTVTGQEISDAIFTDKANTDAIDGLLLALAEGKNNKVSKFLSVLTLAASNAYYELSGEKEFDEWVESAEFNDYVASINHAAMM
ncbi:MAG TPA: hypothetical protein PLC01_00075 [Methylotenera sp.]|nr:hypothetical protein [Methylotenera sp.]